MRIKILPARTNAENTTSRQPIAEQQIAKAPDLDGSGLLRFIFVRFIFLWLIGYPIKC
jgi:hypothetical protein